MYDADMERYTPGDAPHVRDFMARRTLESHGAFFRPHLWPGALVLDCGCGPGSITAGIAEAVSPGGWVAAVDLNTEQLDVAVRADNITYRAASAYELPFNDQQFDCVFAHALFEHLAEPERAARELWRVLKPGGAVGLRSPDWSGRLAGPPLREVDEALERYGGMQTANGGNLAIGRSLGAILVAAGFTAVRVTASYERYPRTELIGEYLARQLEASWPEAASSLRRWHRRPDAFFAQAWCEAVARREEKR